MHVPIHLEESIFLLLLLFLIKCISSQAIVNINVEKKLQQSNTITTQKYNVKTLNQRKTTIIV